MTRPGQQRGVKDRLGRDGQTDNRHAGVPCAAQPFAQRGDGFFFRPRSIVSGAPHAGQLRAFRHKAGVEAQACGAQFQRPIHIFQKNIRRYSRHARQELDAEFQTCRRHGAAARLRHFSVIPAPGLAQCVIVKALHSQFHQIQLCVCKFMQNARGATGAGNIGAERIGPGGAAPALHFSEAAVSRVQGKSSLPLLCGQSSEGSSVESQFNTLFRPGFIQKFRRRPQILIHIVAASGLAILRAKDTSPRTACKGKKNR